MSKPITLEFGKYYHIFSRGIDRCNIFFEERNYVFFMKRYSFFVEPIADTYAFSLLRNHFHVMIRTRTVDEQLAWQSQKPRALQTGRTLNPSQQIGNLLNSYTKAINQAYGRTGSLFQHPFRRIEVGTEEYRCALVAYIHRNPQKHGLIDDFRRWPYSSYETLVLARASWLRRNELIDWFGDVQAFEALHNHPVMCAQLVPLELEGW